MKNIKFLLDHDSAKERIHLQLNDPSVSTCFTRASRRSTGFTHFVALKTILHAQEHEAEASSYIWLFDEPGLHLHPSGQTDLMQVLETLAQQNQIVYSTHSLFTVNKNFPPDIV